MEAIAKFVGKLQSSDDTTKRRALILSVTVLMVIVVVMWLRYFNGLVAAPAAVSSNCCAADGAGSFSPFQTVQSAAGTLGRAVYASLSRLASFIWTPAAYTITPGQ